MICVPLKAAGNVFGCLELANKRSGTYSEEDYQLVMTTAKELATGFKAQEQKQAYEQSAKVDEAFRESVGQIANENLLTPLLKMVLIILADLLKSEK